MNPDSNAEPDSEPVANAAWQRLSQETPDAFTAFSVYLELGFDASLTDVAQKTGRTYCAIRNLSSRHHWFERAAAWRQHTALASLAARKAQQIQDQQLCASRQQILREQEWERSQSIALFCNQALINLLSDPQAKIAPYELATLLRLASQSGREATTANVSAADVPLDKNSDPVIRELRACAAKVCASATQQLPPQQPPPASEPPSPL